MSDEQIPQVRMRDGNVLQPQTAELGSKFPSDPHPGVRYEINANGTTIGVKWWSALERLKFFEMLGGENTGNPGVLSVAMPAYLISDVGETKFQKRPLSRDGLEKKIDAIGDAAILPVWAAIYPTMLPPNTEDDQAKADADLKNG